MPATPTQHSVEKPLTIELLICPKCRKPNRVDATAFKSTEGWAAFCFGPTGARHPKVRTVATRFEEVVSDA